MCYVGSSVNMGNRIKSHLSAARTGRKTCISRAIREFGEDAFDFEVLLECPKEQLLERERFYIVLLNAASVNGFNTMSKPCANYDVFPNEVTRARISAACKGRVFSEEHKAKIAASNSGKKLSKECREKISATLTGRKLSRERIAQMRIAGTGRKLSAEACEKVRLSKIGLSPSAETRAKISKSLSLTAAKCDKNASRLYPERRPRGNKHPNSKLNEASVREIRATYESCEVSETELGARFGVSQATINRVLNGQAWNHVV